MSDAPLVEAAPAKVNLALHVTGRRPTAITSSKAWWSSPMSPTSSRPRPPAPTRLTVTGPFAAASGSGDTNLVIAGSRRVPRALARCMCRRARHRRCSKNLPVAAGIGGGSADAAAALRLMAILGEADIAVGANCSSLALALGADVPACLMSRPLRGARRRRDRAARCSNFPRCHIVLVNPLVPVVTADVFRRLEQRRESAAAAAARAADASGAARPVAR